MMCGTQELNGADSGQWLDDEGTVLRDLPRPWSVTIVDRHDPDARPKTVTLTCYGMADVRNQVAEMSGYVLLSARAA